jgi:hypothetical protein
VSCTIRWAGEGSRYCVNRQIRNLAKLIFPTFVVQTLNPFQRKHKRRAASNAEKLVEPTLCATRACMCVYVRVRACVCTCACVYVYVCEIQSGLSKYAVLQILDRKLQYRTIIRRTIQCKYSLFEKRVSDLTVQFKP